MADFEKNRRILYSKIPKKYKKYKGVDLTLDQFNKIWYKDENIFSEGNINLYKYLNDNVDDMFAKLDTVRTALKYKRSFYRTFACDLEWAKKYTYCGSIQDDVNTAGLVGKYDTNNPIVKTIDISLFKDVSDIDVLYLTSIDFRKIPAISKYIGSEITFILKPISNLIFSINKLNGETIDNLEVEFTVTGFELNLTLLGISKPVLVATKKDSTSSENIDTTDNKDNTVPVVKKDENMGFKSRTITFGKRPEDKTPTKQCDDFPFELGCINKKIGDLSAKMFRGDRENDTYNKTVQGHLDSLGYFDRKNPNKLLTQDVYNSKFISESVKKVLKEYINKK